MSKKWQKGTPKEDGLYYLWSGCPEADIVMGYFEQLENQQYNLLIWDFRGLKSSCIHLITDFLWCKIEEPEKNIEIV